MKKTSLIAIAIITLAIIVGVVHADINYENYEIPPLEEKAEPFISSPSLFGEKDEDTSDGGAYKTATCSCTTLPDGTTKCYCQDGGSGGTT